MKHLLAITIALLPSATLAQQFTPQQMLDVMTKSPANRDVRVHDDSVDGNSSGEPLPSEQVSVNFHLKKPNYVPSQPNGDVFD